MPKMTKISGQRGFTLIELMIVVAIIGILAAVAVPKFAEMIRKSKEGAAKGSLSAMRSALTIYMSDNEGVQMLSRTPPTASLDNALVQYFVPKYMESIPYSKLGTYHVDSNSINVKRTTGVWDGNRSSDTPIAGTGGDANGWIYTSAGDSVFWVNCGHTDTKNESISGW